MSNITNTISEVLKDKSGKSYTEVMTLVEEALSALNMQRALETWQETRINPDCKNAGNIEARTCHKVDHGDGTYSETWCDTWHCL
jgi:hypothetical protein